MNSPVQAPISLEKAKQLVALLEADENEAAADLLQEATLSNSIELFAEVGKLTRQLHDSCHNFQLDPRISNLATEEIPDAQSRLTYVMETTEAAANTTMDAIEKCMRINEEMHLGLEQVIPEWKKLMSRKLQSQEFAELSTKLNKFLTESPEATFKMSALLTDVLVAQGFQDITGQVIRRVIELVKEVENSLVQMLTVFGVQESNGNPMKNEISKHSAKETDNQKAEGPIIDAGSRDDVVSGQDDVDDLLSSLGF